MFGIGLHIYWPQLPGLESRLLGCSINAKVGALTYNLAHHKALALAAGVVGLFLANDYWLLAGVILFGYLSLDRMFGYSLGYNKKFKFTHLGEVGSQKKPEQTLDVIWIKFFSPVFTF